MSAGSKGTVWVNWLTDDRRLWTASWQRGPEVESVEGSRETVVAWALAHRADARWIFDSEAGDSGGYVPLLG